MKNMAIIQGGLVTNVIVWDGVSPIDPSAIEIPSSGAGIGWGYDGTNFIAPAPASDPVYSEADRIAGLWSAANDYQTAQISGAALSLLTLGVIQSRPKSLAIMGWIQSIWTEYYTRKASVSGSGAMPNLNFSSFGSMPYTVPQLMLEMSV